MMEKTMMMPEALAPPVRDALNRELVTGERILWSASPSASRMKAGFAIWLFAIPWTAFAIFWEAMATIPWLARGTPDTIRWSAGIAMPLFGLPFILIGLWMLASPLRAMMRARRTAYALTDRRLIRIVAGRTTQASSVFIDLIGPVERSERRDGWGTLRVETYSRVDGDRVAERFEMAGIPDVARVQRLLMERRRDGA